MRGSAGRGRARAAPRPAGHELVAPARSRTARRRRQRGRRRRRRAAATPGPQAGARGALDRPSARAARSASRSRPRPCGPRAQLLDQRAGVDPHRAGDLARCRRRRRSRSPSYSYCSAQRRAQRRALGLARHLAAQHDPLARRRRQVAARADRLAEAALDAARWRADVLDRRRRLQVAQVDARVAAEQDVGVEHAVGVGERLDAPHQLGGLRAPLVLDVGRHVAPGAVLGLQRAVVLVDDQRHELGHERLVAVAVRRLGEGRASAGSAGCRRRRGRRRRCRKPCSPSSAWISRVDSAIRSGGTQTSSMISAVPCGRITPTIPCMPSRTRQKSSISSCVAGERARGSSSSRPRARRARRASSAVELGLVVACAARRAAPRPRAGAPATPRGCRAASRPRRSASALTISSTAVAPAVDEALDRRGGGVDVGKNSRPVRVWRPCGTVSKHRLGDERQRALGPDEQPAEDLARGSSASRNAQSR